MLNQFLLRPLLLAILGMGAFPALADTTTASNEQNTIAAPATPEGNTALVRITRFDVKGNTLLDNSVIEQVLAPYKGDAKSFTDIQRALEDLEGAYRAAGYSAVHVVTPEQEITNGTVTFEVIETTVGTVAIKGNEHFSKENIRAALPALVEGKTPSARELSQNIRLANENPSRQVDVVLAIGEAENTVDATVNVMDSSPHKFFVTLDNTGNSSTGMNRVGVGYQHNNVFDTDQAMTFEYVTSPGHYGDVHQVSASYRIPMYKIGDSIDLIASHSNVNVIGGTSTSVAGVLAISNGTAYSVHYNYYFPRAGEYTSKLIGALDYRSNGCVLPQTSAVCQGSSAPLTVHPLSLTYTGNSTSMSTVMDISATLLHNLQGGPNGGQSDFDSSNALGAGAKAGYSLMRFNGSVSGNVPQGWQYRLAGNLQQTQDMLPITESLGLVGANAVRGFVERELNNDKGYVLNAELYTPELAPKIKMTDGSVRLLAFIDHGRGWNVSDASVAAKNISSAGSVGVGVRLVYGKHLTAKLDVAHVTELSSPDAPNISTKSGNSRGTFSILSSW